MRPSRLLDRRVPRVAAAVLAVTVLAGCTSTASPSGDAAIAVTSTDDACEVAAASAPAGSVTFRVQNSGTQVTEVYVYGADGEQVVGEAENIGPGLSRDLVVQLAPGDYQVACKPGMTGEGIRATFTAT